MNDAAPLVPTRHKLDVDAFYRMAEVGIIGKHDRVELIDGELIDMPPIGEDHAYAVDLLNERLVLASHGQAITSVQNPLRLDRYNQPQPDFTLYRRQPGKRRDPADALLVVEVADTSLRYDNTVKLGLYAAFGIPEYWIVDIPNRRVVVHRAPGADGYAEVTILSPGLALPLAAAPDIVIELGSLFG
jgi:Uma2 family endonuclease